MLQNFFYISTDTSSISIVYKMCWLWDRGNIQCFPFCANYKITYWKMERRESPGNWYTLNAQNHNFCWKPILKVPSLISQSIKDILIDSSDGPNDEQENCFSCRYDGFKFLSHTQELDLNEFKVVKFILGQIVTEEII